MKRILSVVALAALSVVATGCATSQSGDTYSRDEARRVMTFQEGTLQAVRQVKLEGTKSGIGTVAGAVAGGIGGSGVGQGRGAAVAAVVGAVVGGVVGSAAEEGITREAAWELTVNLDNGKSMVIVQAKGEDQFVPGERVRVLQSGGTTRVTH
ncbi:glycine zipper domain-containing protein [Uliginosibacterium gangwonense]|uniref:glycine zipper domain-containing protein n=1 Tax=Uliginosibacterium gangwonense TaxID=392736 RepID=UPI00036EF0D0|nr:glycine zipper domain-containing protein [Uliginosibacterium gangwonense]